MRKGVTEELFKSASPARAKPLGRSTEPRIEPWHRPMQFSDCTLCGDRGGIRFPSGEVYCGDCLKIRKSIKEQCDALGSKA
jgi:hypothetical protein